MTIKYRKCVRCGLEWPEYRLRWSKIFKGFVCRDRKDCTDYLNYNK